MFRTFAFAFQLVLLCLMALLAPASAEPAASALQTVSLLDAQVKRLPLGEHLVILRDSQHQLELADLRDPQRRLDWQASRETTPNLGLTDDSVWFAVRLDNPHDEAAPFLLELGYPKLDRIDVFLVRDDRLVAQRSFGELRPFAERPYWHRQFLMPLELPAQSQTDLYVRVISGGALQLPLTLWKQQHFMEMDQYGFGGQMIFLGLLVALGLYNLLLFLSLRHISYLWYVLNAFTIALVQMSISGFTFQFLWPDWPQLNDTGLACAISINITFTSMFAYHFLEVYRHSRPLAWLVLTFAALGVVLSLLSLVLPYNLMIKTLIGTTLLMPMMLGVGLILWRMGVGQARYYTIAWSFLFLGHSIQALDKYGWWPHNLIAQYAPQIGTALELLLLSFALAYRMNEERRRRMIAQEQALLAKQEANEQLEGRVQERTQELEAANRRLQEMSAVDGLTQVKNRKFFEETLAREWNRNSRQPSEMALLMVDGDYFKRINDTYGHLCGDACLQHLAAIFQNSVQRAGDFVARYGGEEFALLLCHTSLQGTALLAERIRATVEASPLLWENRQIAITVSIGVAALLPKPDIDRHLLIKQADEALYQAKAAGRNRVMLYPQAAAAD